jgi:ABC-2 type transport system ATP-binding protein
MSGLNAVVVQKLTKVYPVYERSPGILGSLRGLVHRKRRDVVAVRDLSFNIAPGEMVAFLGPNGAGKTTTLKILSGLLHPTAGEVQVLQFIPWKREAQFLKRFSFVMGQRHQLWWELPALDTFRLNAAIYGIPRVRFQETLEELVSLLELEPLLPVPVKQLSLGQRMKMELACSLLHEPELLLLDEPTQGLDVLMQKSLRDFVKRLNRERGTTVLLTSHNMSDVESVCKRVLLIETGRLVFDGPLDQLIVRFAPHKRLRVDFREPVSADRLGAFQGSRRDDGTTVEFEIERGKAAAAVAQLLRDFPVVDLSIEEPPLEEVIHHIFRQQQTSQSRTP